MKLTCEELWIKTLVYCAYVMILHNPKFESRMPIWALGVICIRLSWFGWIFLNELGVVRCSALFFLFLDERPKLIYFQAGFRNIWLPRKLVFKYLLIWDNTTYYPLNQFVFNKCLIDIVNLSQFTSSVRMFYNSEFFAVDNLISTLFIKFLFRNILFTIMISFFGILVFRVYRFISFAFLKWYTNDAIYL